MTIPTLAGSTATAISTNAKLGLIHAEMRSSKLWVLAINLLILKWALSPTKPAISFCSARMVWSKDFTMTRFSKFSALPNP